MTMRAPNRNASMKTLIGQPAGTALVSGSKICLVLEYGGYLAAMGLTATALEVLPTDASKQPILPPHFECCVFYVTAVDRWQQNSAMPSMEQAQSTNRAVNINYGDLVQFCHVRSQRWLCVHMKQHSSREKSSLRVSLAKASELDEDTMFRFKVAPRYKVRSEGERVQTNDQIMLIPDGDDCRYLHASQPADGSRELNCAFHASAWTIQLYDNCHLEPTAVRVGVPVALFHAETEAFLSSDTFQYDARRVDLRDRVCTAPVWISSVPSLTVTGAQLPEDSSPDTSIKVERVDSEIVLPQSRDRDRRGSVDSDYSAVLRSYFAFPSPEFQDISEEITPKALQYGGHRHSIQFGKALLPLRSKDSFAIIDTSKFTMTQLPPVQGLGKELHRISTMGSLRKRSKSSLFEQGSECGRDAFTDFVEDLRGSHQSHVELQPSNGGKCIVQSNVAYLLHPHPTLGDSKQPASNSIWIIEQEDPTQGGPVEFYTFYRLKHVASGQYLGVKENTYEGRLEWVMSDKREDEHNIFVFLPIDQEHQQAVKPGGFFVIQHVSSSLFLHFAAPDRQAPARVGGYNVTYLVLSQQLFYEDVFVLNTSFPLGELVQLNEVLECIQHMRNYVEQFWNLQNTFQSAALQSAIEPAREATIRLINMCTVSDDTDPLTRTGLPIPDHQQLLLDQNVHKLIIDMVKCPFEHCRKGTPSLLKYADFDSPTVVDIKLMVKLGYRLLMMMVKGSARFAILLYPYLSVMQLHMAKGFDITGTLIEIFKDNQAVLKHMGEQVLDCFVDMLSQNRKHRAGFIRLLGELCWCNGQGIVRHQNFICRRLVLARGSAYITLKNLISFRMCEGALEVFAYPQAQTPRRETGQPTAGEYYVNLVKRIKERDKDTAVGRTLGKVMQGVQIKHLFRPSRELSDYVPDGSAAPPDSPPPTVRADSESVVENWVTISHFSRAASRSMRSLLEAFLTLFPRLCIGGNSFTTPIVQECVTKEMVVAVLGPDSPHRDLPPLLVAKFYDIATYCYIDSSMYARGCEGYHKTIKVWATLQTSADHNPLSEDPFLVPLKTASLPTLNRYSSLALLTPDRMHLIHSVLRMWHFLVLYRLYTAQELEELLGCLVQILSDELSYDECRTPRKAMSRSKSILEIKMEKENQERYSLGEENLVLMQCREVALNILSELLDQYLEHTVRTIMAEFARCHAEISSRSGAEAGKDAVFEHMMRFVQRTMARRRLDAAEKMRFPEFPLAHLQGVLGAERVSGILLQLTLYDYEPLINVALSLLLRTYDFESEVSRLLLEQHVLFSERGAAVWAQAAALVKDLQGMADASLFSAAPDMDQHTRQILIGLLELIAPGDVMDEDTDEDEEDEPEVTKHPSFDPSLRSSSGSDSDGDEEAVEVEVLPCGSPKSKLGALTFAAKPSAKQLTPRQPPPPSPPPPPPPPSPPPMARPYIANTVELDLTQLQPIGLPHLSVPPPAPAVPAVMSARKDVTFSEPANNGTISVPNSGGHSDPPTPAARQFQRCQSSLKEVIQMERHKIGLHDQPKGSKWSHVMRVVRQIKSRKTPEMQREMANELSSNRDILRHLNVPPMLLRLMQLPFSDLPTQRPRRRMLEVAYRLLQRFCDDNPANQAAVATIPEAVPLFLQHLQYNLGADQALIKLYEKNYALTSHIHEDVIRMFLELGLKAVDDTTHLNFLKEVAVVGGLPVSSNQTTIMNTLIEQQSGLLRDGLDPDIVRKPEPLQRTQATIVDLIANCCVGFNSSTESPAQGFMSLNMNLDILRRPGSMKLEYQLPYLKFLCEVWWLRESSKASSGTWLINESFWFVLDRFNHLLMEINNDIIDLSLGTVRQHLIFIYDGIIPTLTTFLTSASEEEILSLLPPQVLELFRSLLDNLVLLSQNKVHSIYLGSVHLQALETCLLKFQSTKISTREDLQEVADAAGVQARQLAKSAHSAPGLSEQAEQLACVELHRLQDAMMECHGKASVESPTPLTQLLYDYMGTDQAIPVIRKLVVHLEQSKAVSKYVKVGLLRLLTQIIHKSQLEKSSEENRLCEMQLRLSAPHQFDTMRLVATLGDCDDEVAWALVSYAIAVLEGGNPTAQGALLQLFRNRKEVPFSKLAKHIQSASQMLKERSRGKAFLDHQLFSDPAEREACEQLLERQEEVEHITALLRLLQLFCEGHHIQFQNYVRFQDASLHSHNMVSEVMAFMKDVVDAGMGETLSRIALQGFNTLTEFCQGPCPRNQAALVQCNVSNEVNIVFQDQNLAIDDDLAFELRSASVVMLLSLLEGNTDRSRTDLMVMSLEFDPMRQTLDAMWESVRQGVEEGEMLADHQEETLDLAFNLYVLLYQLNTWSENTDLQAILKECNGSEFFESMLCVIEIARGDTVEKVYFRNPTTCNMLRPEVKADVIATVSRQSAISRLTDFFYKSDQLIRTIEFQVQLKHRLIELYPAPPRPASKGLGEHVYWSVKMQVRRWVLAIPTDGHTMFQNAALVVALLINLMLCLVWTGGMMNEMVDEMIHADHVDFRETFLTASIRASTQALGVLLLALHVASVYAFVWFRPPHIPVDWGRAYVHAFFILCAMAALSYSPLLFSIHLLGIINKSVLLRNVMQSVTLNGGSLLMTAILACVVVYIFSLVGFVLFLDDFRMENGAMICSNVLECFIFVLCSGVRSGGGVGDLLTARPTALGRVAYDFSFFVIVIVCLLNIVSGVIIDTFAQLRDSRQAIEEDTRQKCFICNIEASAFDRLVDGGFEQHIKASHNMWCYLYFMQHLRRKPVHEFTGQESYVHEKVMRRDISFYPLNRSLDYDQALAREKTQDLQRMGASQPQQSETAAHHMPILPSPRVMGDLGIDRDRSFSDERFQQALEALDQKWATRMNDLQKQMETQFAGLADLLKRNAAGAGRRTSQASVTTNDLAKLAMRRHLSPSCETNVDAPSYMQPTISSAAKNKQHPRSSTPRHASPGMGGAATPSGSRQASPGMALLFPSAMPMPNSPRSVSPVSSALHDDF